MSSAGMKQRQATPYYPCAAFHAHFTRRSGLSQAVCRSSGSAPKAPLQPVHGLSNHPRPPDPQTDREFLRGFLQAYTEPVISRSH